MAANHRNERGAGVLSSALGAAAFLGFLLLATHVIVGLYATSVVTHTTHQTARMIATGAASAAATERGVSHAYERLSGLHNVSVDVQSDSQYVRVHIIVNRPGLLPQSLRFDAALASIDRSSTVRIEQEVSP